MKFVGIAAALGALMFSLPALGQNWFQFEDKAERFTVNFPGEPTVTDITYPSEYDGVLPAKHYEVSDGTTTYAVTVVNYLEADTTEVRGSVAWAAWNFRKRGGVVNYDAYSQLDRIEGHQLQITNDDMSRTFIAIHVNDKRLFILEATSPPGVPPPAHFQQSLGIFDETGRRVRFEIDANGQRSPTNRGGAYGEAPDGNADVYDIDEELEYQRELEAARAAAAEGQTAN